MKWEIVSRRDPGKPYKHWNVRCDVTNKCFVRDCSSGHVERTKYGKGKGAPITGHEGPEGE